MLAITDWQVQIRGVDPLNLQAVCDPSIRQCDDDVNPTSRPTRQWTILRSHNREEPLAFTIPSQTEKKPREVDECPFLRVVGVSGNYSASQDHKAPTIPAIMQSQATRRPAPHPTLPSTPFIRAMERWGEERQDKLNLSHQPART